MFGTLRLLRRGAVDLADEFLQPADRSRDGLASLGLLARGRGDLFSHLRRFRRRLENVVQRSACFMRERDAIRDELRAGGHRTQRVADFVLHRADEIRNFARRRRGPLRQIANLRGDHGKAFAMLAGGCGEDGGVQRQKVCLLGDVFDDIEDLANGRGAFAEARDDGV